MFKLMLKKKDGSVTKFVAPFDTGVKVHERYESKWLAQRHAEQLNALIYRVRNSGSIVIVPTTGTH